MYAERIKEIRHKLNLSVAKMSEKTGIPARTITGYERAERTPSIEFAAQCCKILNINANWFLTGRGEMFNADENQLSLLKSEMRSEMIELLKEKGII